MHPFAGGWRGTRLVSFVLGAALLAWLIASSDIPAIWTDLARVGPGLVAIVVLEFVTHALNTLGWWFTLPPSRRLGTYGRLFWTRLAGNALSDSTPTASFGGEPAKIFLLSTHLPASVATASLLAARLCQSAAKAIFIVAGIALAWPRASLPPGVSLALLAGFVLVASGIALFAAIQVIGIGTAVVRLLRHAHLPARWIGSAEQWLQGVDAHLDDLYRTRAGDLVRSLIAHLCALGCGVLQVLLLLRWLGLGYDVVAAVGIEAFATLLGMVAFAVPGTLGVQEGGKVLVFGALGMPRSAGMAVGIAFRLASLIQTVVGLVALSFLHRPGPLGGRSVDPARAGTRSR